MRKIVKERAWLGGVGKFRRRGCCSLAELCDFCTQNSILWSAPRGLSCEKGHYVPIRLLFGGARRIGVRKVGQVLWRNMWPLRTQKPQIQDRIYEGPLFRQDVGSCDQKDATPYQD